MWSVSPKQVANFWVGGRDGVEAETRSAKRSKIEKKQKIDLVHRWLSQGDGVDGELGLSFVEGAAETKRAFLDAANHKRAITTGGGKARGSISLEALPSARISKLDDLADCLLQAAAWCKWEQNRSALADRTTLRTGTSNVTDDIERNSKKARPRKQGPARKRRSDARQQP
jgi:hypothetical protein